MARNLDAKDHKEIFNFENFEPLFKALISYSIHHKEDSGNVTNVRLFKLFYGVSNMCLNGCRALFSQDFEKLLLGVGVGRSPSKEEIDYIRIAYNTVLTPEERNKEYDPSK